MSSTERVSIDGSGSGTEKRQATIDNGGAPQKKMVSLELSTAIGGTLEGDVEQRTLIGDSKESEENLKDVLKSKIAELEVNLRQTDEYYVKLSKEVSSVKALYDREKEECEDVVSVAKRNIEGQVAKILELQGRKRELASKIAKEEAKLDKEEEQTRIQLKSEEERLTRNVVILQTKLLINEGMKFERDKMLSKIEELQTELVEKENFYQAELKKAKDQIQEKYERLFKIARNHQGSIGEQVKNLSLRQQIAALKHAQEQIMRTQSAYKKASKKMLHLLDENRTLEGKNHSIEVQVALQQSLVNATYTIDEDLIKRTKDADTAKKQREKFAESRRISEDLMVPIRQKIEDLRNQLYKYQDEEANLNEILEDQRSYLNVVKNQKQILHEVEQRLIPLADVAEHIVQKGKVVLRQDFEDPAARYDMFQKLSAILAQSEELSKHFKSQEGVDENERDGADSLPPLRQETLRKKDSSRTNTSEYSSFSRGLNPVEKKILSDLGLLGKYGAKRKKFVNL